LTDKNDMNGIALAIMLLTLCAPVAARECVSPSSLELTAKYFPVVLSGRAVSSRDEVLSDDRGMFSEVVFNVQRLWKGNTPRQIRLYQPITPDRIQFGDAIGVEYVVFARELSAAQRVLYSVPPNVTGLTIDYCASKPASGRDLTPLGKSRMPAA
jgi:hypothetical protein